MKDFKKSVVYQIYPKSFKDSDGDGVGDLKGITQRMDYLKTLGVDCIWITPFYMSPQRDNGYDIADYLNIDPLFGTMEDFELLVKEANNRDIDIMLDMVFNHSSTEHQWFKNALKGSAYYKDFYIFKEPKNGKAPTNWISKFGGPAWEYVEDFDEYYLHLFDVTQADLNWDNEDLRKEIYRIVNFWIEKGVKGFRLDVINLISKPEVFVDDLEGDGRRFYTDGPNIHKYLKELNKNTFGKYEDVITVGEMSSTTLEDCIKYSSPEEEELSMVFNFHHLKVDYKDDEKWTLMDFDFIKLKEILEYWQVGIQEGNGWNAVFWCNHDQPRIVSRFGDDGEYIKESAKMLATTIHMLRGTPYIYQGEEIGMTDPKFEYIDDYRDVETINIYNEMKEKGIDEDLILKIVQSKSRDNSRTPMQWNSSKNAGFTSGTPWINLAPNYQKINVENSLEDRDSIFWHYKKLIDLRKRYDIIAYGSFRMILKDHKEIFAYIREYEDEKLLVVNNFYNKATLFVLPTELDLDDYESKILLSNYKNLTRQQNERFRAGTPDKKILLRPYESIVYHLVRKGY